MGVSCIWIITRDPLKRRIQIGRLPSFNRHADHGDLFPEISTRELVFNLGLEILRKLRVIPFRVINTRRLDPQDLLSAPLDLVSHHGWRRLPSTRDAKGSRRRLCHIPGKVPLSNGGQLPHYLVEPIGVLNILYLTVLWFRIRFYKIRVLRVGTLRLNSDRVVIRPNHADIIFELAH